MISILTLIPARSGSKGIPDKNIKLLNGKPLIQYSIDQAKKSKYTEQMRIIVSTDSEKYASIAKKLGAECPFLRPTEISQDLSTDYQFIEHALNYLKKKENYIPDIILQLRPTQPLRRVEDIDKCLDIFIQKRNNYDSLRSVTKFEKSPYKMYSIEGENLIPLFKEINGIKEPYNECRQHLPDTYLHTGYIDIFNSKIIRKGTISGDRVYPYVLENTGIVDIDTMYDWEKAEKLLS
tara:strand:- start:1045 stop:1752 length:708 start_codon:yes stop_codon:yes gene_type:complete